MHAQRPRGTAWRKTVFEQWLDQKSPKQQGIAIGYVKRIIEERMKRASVDADKDDKTEERPG